MTAVAGDRRAGLTPGEWARHRRDLSETAYRDGYAQAQGSPPHTYRRLLSGAEDAAWWDGWRAGHADRAQAAAPDTAAFEPVEAPIGQVLLDAARIAVAQYLATQPRLRPWRDEMISDAAAAAAGAAARHNPATGVPLGAYALRRAKGAVIDGVRERSPLTRGEHARGLTYRDLPEHRKLAHSVEALREVGVHPPDPYDFTERIADRDLAVQMLGRCTSRERLVLVATVMQRRTLDDVAAELGVTPARVIQLRNGALARLRRYPLTA